MSQFDTQLKLNKFRIFGNVRTFSNNVDSPDNALSQSKEERRRKNKLSNEELDKLREEKKKIVEATRKPRESLLTPLSEMNTVNRNNLENINQDTTITTLSNGMKVVSQDSFDASCAVCLHVDLGTRYETPETAGICHLIERLAYKVKQFFEYQFNIYSHHTILHQKISFKNLRILEATFLRRVPVMF